MILCSKKGFVAVWLRHAPAPLLWIHPVAKNRVLMPDGDSNAILCSGGIFIVGTCPPMKMDTNSLFRQSDRRAVQCTARHFLASPIGGSCRRSRLMRGSLPGSCPSSGAYRATFSQGRRLRQYRTHYLLSFIFYLLSKTPPSSRCSAPSRPRRRRRRGFPRGAV